MKEHLADGAALAVTVVVGLLAGYALLSWTVGGFPTARPENPQEEREREMLISAHRTMQTALNESRVEAALTELAQRPVRYSKADRGRLPDVTSLAGHRYAWVVTWGERLEFRTTLKPRYDQRRDAKGKPIMWDWETEMGDYILEEGQIATLDEIEDLGWLKDCSIDWDLLHEDSINALIWRKK